MTPEMIYLIPQELNEKWSPEQIPGWLRKVINITIAVMVKQAENKYKIALALNSELPISHYQLRWQQNSTSRHCGDDRTNEAI